MKYNIDYGSLNVPPGAFSLDKFIGSDDPGTLSWLNNMEANDLNLDIPPFREVELSAIGAPCRLLCAWCRSQQLDSPAR
jgi:hypothetical protein